MSAESRPCAAKPDLGQCLVGNEKLFKAHALRAGFFRVTQSVLFCILAGPRNRYFNEFTLSIWASEVGLPSMYMLVF